MFVGFPTATGNGHCFTNITDQFAMNASSKNKDGAWEFLKLLLSEEYQDSMYVRSGAASFPTNKNSLDRLADFAAGRIKQTDSEETAVFQGAMPDYSYRAAAEDEISQILDLIDQTDKISYTQSEILDIVEEEAQVYFAGEKTVEETQAITQQRVTVYLSERQ